MHGGAAAVALALDLAAELLGEAVDEPAAEPGIGALGSSPLPSSATVRRSSPGPRFSVTMTVPFASPGKAYLTALVTSSLTMSPIGIARSVGSCSLAMSVLSTIEVSPSLWTEAIRSRHNSSR